MKILNKAYLLLSLLVLKVHVWALSVQQSVASKPFERSLMQLSAATTVGGLFFVTSAAHADGGLASMVDVGAAQGDSIKTNAGKLFAVGGFIGAAVGSWNWWKKGKEGENSRITGNQIWVPIVAGAALGATGFMLIKAGETIGIASSSQGQLPQ